MKFRFHYYVEVVAQKELIVTAETKVEADATVDAIVKSNQIPVTSSDILDVTAELVEISES